jgi:hypothetical protein
MSYSPYVNLETATRSTTPSAPLAAAMNGKFFKSQNRLVENTDFLELEPSRSKEDPVDCFSRVTVSPKLKQMTNDITFLIARDKKTNEQFKCRVGFGRLNRLMISKRFDKMNTGEIFELDVLVIKHFNPLGI